MLHTLRNSDNAFAANQDPALLDINGGLSLSECSSRIDHIAKWLRSLDARVVALHGENSAAWVLVDLACQQAGIVCIPLPTFFSDTQLDYCISVSGADLVLSDQPTFRKILGKKASACKTTDLLPFFSWQSPPSGIPDLPRGTQKITFTSGSTGSPKGVCLSTEHQWRVAHSLASAIGIEKPRHLCLLPLSTLLENIAGIYSPLLSGGSIHLPDDQTRGLHGSSGLNADALLSCIDSIAPHSMILLPQLLAVMVNACQQGWSPPASLVFAAVGGAKVSTVMLKTARDYGLPVYQGYGLSECASVVALNTPACDNPETTGKVLEHCTVEIDHGEVVVSGSSHLGYLGAPKSWHQEKIHTGDLGSLHSSQQGNFLSIDGRKKSTLITAFGRNVSPEWIEAELMAKPLLNRCMVVGDTHPHLAVLVDAAENIPDRAINSWINEVNARLPDYARLKNWSRIPSQGWHLFSTANGRIQRSGFSNHFAHKIQALYKPGMGQTAYV